MEPEERGAVLVSQLKGSAKRYTKTFERELLYSDDGGYYVLGLLSQYYGTDTVETSSPSVQATED